MKKMSEKAMRNANGGLLRCPYCGRVFFFWFGWEKAYDKHVAKCR